MVSAWSKCWAMSVTGDGGGGGTGHARGGEEVVVGDVQGCASTMGDSFCRFRASRPRRCAMGRVAGTR